MSTMRWCAKLCNVVPCAIMRVKNISQLRAVWCGRANLNAAQLWQLNGQRSFVVTCYRRLRRCGCTRRMNSLGLAWARWLMAAITMHFRWNLFHLRKGNWEDNWRRWTGEVASMTTSTFKMCPGRRPIAFVVLWRIFMWYLVILPMIVFRECYKWLVQVRWLPLRPMGFAVRFVMQWDPLALNQKHQERGWLALERRCCRTRSLCGTMQVSASMSRTCWTAWPTTTLGW